MPRERSNEPHNGLSAKIIQVAAEAARRGHSDNGISRLLGYNGETFRYWLNAASNEKATPKMRALSIKLNYAIGKAREERLAAALETINRAATGFTKTKIKRVIHRELVRDRDGNPLKQLDLSELDPHNPQTGQIGKWVPVIFETETETIEQTEEFLLAAAIWVAERYEPETFAEKDGSKGTALSIADRLKDAQERAELMRVIVAGKLDDSILDEPEETKLLTSGENDNGVQR